MNNLLNTDAATPTTEATIKISREDGKVTSISVWMPVWEKHSEQGNLFIHLPLLGLETVAKDSIDADVAVKEAIGSFCIAAEKFGQGIEKELEALGWVQIDGETGEPALGYNLSADTNAVIDRIIQTGENYINEHLELA